MLRGTRGTYLYICNPQLREYLSQRIEIANKPNLTLVEDKPQLEYVTNPIPFEDSIPLYDLRAAAGAFSEIQPVEDSEWIKPPEGIRLTKDLFACKVIGESMNQIIPDGSICLFRKPGAGSRDGLIVLCEHETFETNNFGSSYTVKEYSSLKEEIDGSWRHKRITLKPKSTDLSFETIILEDDDLDNFNVRGIFEKVLFERS